MRRPRARLLSRSQHPHKVAAACVRVALAEARDPTFRVDTLATLRGPPGTDACGTWVPAALLAWAQRVTFMREPGALGERILRPRRTIELDAGDCDDIATAVVAMALTLGIRATTAVRLVSRHGAHVAAVIAPDWCGSPPTLVVDPLLPAFARLADGDEWHWARVTPEPALLVPP